MVCPQCGKETPEGSAFCAFCGAPSGGGDAPARTEGEPAPRFGTLAPDIQTYLVHSILATLFCCIPFGVVAIVFSVMATSAKNAGRFTEAVANAKQAWTWVKVSFWLGLISLALNILIVVFFLLFAAVGTAVS